MKQSLRKRELEEILPVVFDNRGQVTVKRKERKEERREEAQWQLVNEERTTGCFQKYLVILDAAESGPEYCGGI